MTKTYAKSSNNFRVKLLKLTFYNHLELTNDNKFPSTMSQKRIFFKHAWHLYTSNYESRSFDAIPKAKSSKVSQQNPLHRGSTRSSSNDSAAWKRCAYYNNPCASAWWKYHHLSEKKEDKERRRRSLLSRARVINNAWGIKGRASAKLTNNSTCFRKISLGESFGERRERTCPDVLFGRACTRTKATRVCFRRRAASRRWLVTPASIEPFVDRSRPFVRKLSLQALFANSLLPFLFFLLLFILFISRLSLEELDQTRLCENSHCCGFWLINFFVENLGEYNWLD